MKRTSKWLSSWMVLTGAVLALAAIPSEARRFFNDRIEITEYSLEGRVNMPLHMDFDEQGNLWVGAFRDGKMLRYTYNGDTQVYDVERNDIDPSKGPMNIYADPRDGSVWFSAIGNYIVNLKVGGVVTTYSIADPKAMPMGVRGDSKGNIWFSEMFNGNIGVIRNDGKMESFQIPNRMALPTGIAVDGYDNKWFAMSGVGMIGVLRANGTFGEYNLGIGAHPMGISRSLHQKSNLVWFTETVGNKIGSINPVTGEMKLYRIPTVLSMPMTVMEDEYGDVWFTEFSGNQIGKLNVSDGSYRVTEYKIPTMMGAPMGLAMHPNNGSVWFSEVMRNRIGYLINPLAPPVPPMPMP